LFFLGMRLRCFLPRLFSFFTLLSSPNIYTSLPPIPQVRPLFLFVKMWVRTIAKSPFSFSFFAAVPLTGLPAIPFDDSSHVHVSFCFSSPLPTCMTPPSRYEKICPPELFPLILPCTSLPWSLLPACNLPHLSPAALLKIDLSSFYHPFRPQLQPIFFFLCSDNTNSFFPMCRLAVCFVR